MFKYTNNLNSAIIDHLKFDDTRRKLLCEPSMEIDDKLLAIFMNAIKIYEDCIVDVISQTNIPIDFLYQPTKFSVNEFPWLFTYVYSKNVSLDVNIAIDQKIELAFTMIKTRFNEGNIIRLNVVPDQYLCSVDWARTPSTYMVEHKIQKAETNFVVKIDSSISDSNYGKLFEYHKFIENKYPSLKKLFC